MNFGALLDIHARSNPEGLALADASTGEQWTWWELLRDVDNTAAALSRLGLRDRDRVGMQMFNSGRYVLVFLALLRLGVIPVCMNARWRYEEMRFVLADSGASVIIVSDEFLDEARRLLSDEVVSIGLISGVAFDGQASDQLVHLDGVVQHTEGCSIAVARQNGDIADLMYTSGSTGNPKAVIHHHGYHFANAFSLADYLRLDRSDVGLAISPMFHQSGQMVWSIAYGMGSSLVLLKRWDMEVLFQTIERYRVSFLHLITTILLDIVTDGDEVAARFDTRSVRVTLSGGGSASPAQLARYEQMMGGVLCGGYGRTEGGFCWEPPDRTVRVLGRNGHILGNNAELRIVDLQTGSDCGPAQSGEIQMRGDGVSPGYWRRPSLNIEAFTDDGWMKTGDLGHLDSDGYLYFEGRADHMIKTGGENVYPSEVEKVLLEMPTIAEVAVVGIQDSRLGETVAALVVPTSPNGSAEEVRDWCRGKVAGYKIPRIVVFSSEIRKLGSQKVDYGWVKERLEGQAS